MTDIEKQAQLVAGLRKLAEEAAAKNPALADMRALGKRLVAEMRAKVNDKGSCDPLGASMGLQGEITTIAADGGQPGRAADNVLTKLRALAQEGSLRAAAFSEIVSKQIPG